MNVVDLPLHSKIAGDESIIVWVETLTPEKASNWLKCNRHNRPVRRQHVEFLALEIESGRWQLNGQAIVISRTAIAMHPKDPERLEVL